MSPIGDREKETQRRVIALFQDCLGYEYLGDWRDRAGNSNIEPDLVPATKDAGCAQDGIYSMKLGQLVLHE